MTGTLGPARTRRTLLRRLALAAAGVAVVAVGALAWTRLGTASVTEQGTLYFTTFRHWGLYSTVFTFRGAELSLSKPRLVAALPAADGVAFAPDGMAIVGGQGTGDIYEVDTATGAYRTEPSGCPEAYLLAVDPAGSGVYTAGLPGALCRSPIRPLRAGTRIAVTGDDNKITLVAFDATGTAFYTTGTSAGPGDFGVIDLLTGSTTRTIVGAPFAHGMSYDTATRSIYLFGGTTIAQVDPRAPTRVVSTLSVPHTQFDQGTTDGRGHVFVASNLGQLVVVDVGTTRVIGARANTVSVRNLMPYLDDVAPLVGPGAATGVQVDWTAVTAGAVALVASLVAVGAWLLARTPERRLPAWDLRRRETAPRRHR